MSVMVSVFAGGPQVRFSIGAGDRQSLQPPVVPTLPVTHVAVAMLFQQLGMYYSRLQCPLYRSLTQRSPCSFNSWVRITATRSAHSTGHSRSGRHALSTVGYVLQPPVVPTLPVTHVAVAMLFQQLGTYYSHPQCPLYRSLTQRSPCSFNSWVRITATRSAHSTGHSRSGRHALSTVGYVLQPPVVPTLPVTHVAGAMLFQKLGTYYSHPQCPLYRSLTQRSPCSFKSWVRIIATRSAHSTGHSRSRRHALSTVGYVLQPPVVPTLPVTHVAVAMLFQQLGTYYSHPQCPLYRSLTQRSPCSFNSWVRITAACSAHSTGHSCSGRHALSKVGYVLQPPVVPTLPVTHVAVAMLFQKLGTYYSHPQCQLYRSLTQLSPCSFNSQVRAS